jgi:hypothetical protein
VQAAIASRSLQKGWRLKEPRMWFGFLLLFLMAILAGLLALGKVEEKTSFGLQFILAALSGGFGAFCTWAFGSKDKPE